MPYPDAWEGDVLLADGGTLHVRPIIPEDAERIEAFHGRQSAESIYYRYFSPRPQLSARDIANLTQVDYVDRMAFVGLLGDDLVGVARYDRYPMSSVAEVAFFTDDAHQGRGLATVLLEYLAAAAREVGLTGFTAQVLPQNRKMLSVFKQAGFEASSRFTDGVIEVELSIEPTPEALAVIEARARSAFAQSVRRLLAPRSVAVVGASRRPGSIGYDVVQAAARRRLPGTGVPGQRQRLVRGERALVPVDPRRARRHRPRGGVRIGRPGGSRGRRLRAQAGARPGGDQRGLLRVGRGWGAARGGRGRARPPPRHAPRRPQLHGRGQHRSRRVARRHLRGRAPPPRPHRGVVAVGHARRRHHRPREAPGHRDLHVRVGRQQARRQWQRPAAVLGAGRRHRRGPAPPRVVRQPTQLRPHHPPAHPHQAGGGGEERARGVARPVRPRRVARGDVARRAARPDRRDPRRHPRAALRRGAAARRPAGARGSPRGGGVQLLGPVGARGRRLHRRRPRARRVRAGHPGAPHGAGLGRRCPRRHPHQPARPRVPRRRRRVPQCAHGRVRRSRCRRGRGALHPAGAGRGRRHRRRHRRGRRRHRRHRARHLPGARFAHHRRAGAQAGPRVRVPRGRGPRPRPGGARTASGGRRSSARRRNSTRRCSTTSAVGSRSCSGGTARVG